MSNETPSPFNPDPFDEIVDKESRSPFQATHHTDMASSTEEMPIVNLSDEVIFYSERRHFKAFFKKLWWPKTFTVGTVLIVIFCTVVIFSRDQTQTAAAIALTLTISVCFLYPILRTRFWWLHRIIEVSVRKGQAMITLHEPRSRLYGFKGDDEGINFILTGTVAVKLNEKTWAELYMFRKSGGGMVDTIVNEDSALHNLRDIYRPDLLKQAIEDAMDNARGV